MAGQAVWDQQCGTALEVGDPDRAGTHVGDDEHAGTLAGRAPDMADE
jgi:hypothetical protein